MRELEIVRGANWPGAVLLATLLVCVSAVAIAVIVTEPDRVRAECQVEAQR